MSVVERWETNETPAKQYRGKDIGEVLRTLVGPDRKCWEHVPDMAIYVKSENKTVVRLRLLVSDSYIDENGVIHIAAHISGTRWKIYHFHFDPRFGSVRRSIDSPRINIFTLGYPRYSSKKHIAIEAA